MEVTIGGFKLVEDVSIVVRAGEIVSLRPYGGVVTLNIEFTETESGKGQWTVNSEAPNILKLILENHQLSNFGGTTTDSVPLGEVGGKQLLLRYAFHPYGDTPASRTWLLVCNFGEANA